MPILAATLTNGHFLMNTTRSLRGLKRMKDNYELEFLRRHFNTLREGWEEERAGLAAKNEGEKEDDTVKGSGAGSENTAQSPDDTAEQMGALALQSPGAANEEVSLSPLPDALAENRKNSSQC